jgi:hypothetical protein
MRTIPAMITSTLAFGPAPPDDPSRERVVEPVTDE